MTLPRQTVRHLSAARECAAVGLYSVRCSRNSLTERCANRKIFSSGSRTIRLQQIFKMTSLLTLVKFPSESTETAAMNSSMDSFLWLHKTHFSDLSAVIRLEGPESDISM